VFSALETFVIIAVYKSTFTIPFIIPYKPIQPITLRGPTLLFRVRGDGRSPRPKGPRAGVSLKRGQSTPSPPAIGCLGSAVRVTLKMHDLKMTDKENYGSGKCRTGK